MIKKHFHENFVMSVEEERSFKSSNAGYLINFLLSEIKKSKRLWSCNKKIGKSRGSAHWRCNINLKLTKNVPVIFHNLKGCDSHLIMQKICKFAINKNLVFSGSMQFMSSGLDGDNDFKHLLREFGGEFLRLLKHKGVYPYEYMDSFKKFFDDMLPDRCKCFSSSKDECINEKDYWHAADVCIMFKMNTMDDYHDLYLKADIFLLAEDLWKGY